MLVALCYVGPTGPNVWEKLIYGGCRGKGVMDCTGCLVPDNAFLHVALTLFMFCVSFSALIAYQIFALQSLLSLTNPPPGEEGDTTGRRWTMETLKRCFPPPWAFPTARAWGSIMKAFRVTGSSFLWFCNSTCANFGILIVVLATRIVYTLPKIRHTWYT